MVVEGDSTTTPCGAIELVSNVLISLIIDSGSAFVGGDVGGELGGGGTYSGSGTNSTWPLIFNIVFNVNISSVNIAQL